ncbi:MAG: YtxH domain-containing protein [Bacteroidetes bacterium]|nr:MAG: YtxH domain-containing protein [Bacteroidota bacterium]
MSKDSDSGSFTRGLFLGAFLGGVVGAVTALLLAPKSGAELRKDIAQKSAELYDKATDMLQTVEANIGDSVSTVVNEGKVRAQNIVQSAKSQAEELMSNADAVLKEARSKVHTTKENLGDKIQNVKEAAKAGIDAFRDEMDSSHS